MSKKSSHSAFGLALALQASRSTKGAQRTLLMALILRCNPDKGYTCWPSYRRLADDTQLDEITLRRAAKQLEEKGLIRRKQRTMKSNIFVVNADVLLRHAAEAQEARNQELAEMLGPDLAGSLTTDDVAASEEETDDVDSAADLLALVTGGR